MDIQIDTDICMGFVRGCIGSDTGGRVPSGSENKCISRHTYKYGDVYQEIFISTDICMGFVRGSIGSDTVGRVPSRSVAIICRHNTSHINKQTKSVLRKIKRNKPETGRIHIRRRKKSLSNQETKTNMLNLKRHTTSPRQI